MPQASRFQLPAMTALAIFLAGSIVYFFLPTTGETGAPKVAAPAKAVGDWPMFGGSPSRNMVNLVEKNMPTDWKVEGGPEKFKNIKWAVDVGSRCYGGPIVAGGKVFVGTNNDRPRDKAVKGNKAVVMCFNEADGKFLWQIAHDVPPEEIIREALKDGVCSTPTVEGERLYYVAPGCELVCADVKDGKIVWQLDMMRDLKVFPSYLGNSSPLIYGDRVYVLTANGTNGEGKLVAPEAPSFLAVNKKDGTIAWQSKLPGKNIIEGQWSNPKLATVNGKAQVLFPGGDGYLYGLDADTGAMIWKFNCNPQKDVKASADRGGMLNYMISTAVVVDNKALIGVGLYPEHPIGNKFGGHFWCIDISKKGDLTPVNDKWDPQAPENKDAGLLWHVGGPTMAKGRRYEFGHTMSTAAVHEGLVYISEENGYLNCFDLASGKKHWEHDFKSGIWGSPYWVDGKIYQGTEDGDVVIFAHGREKKVVNTIYMDEAVKGTPVAANGVLYIATATKVYAIAAK